MPQPPSLTDLFQAQRHGLSGAVRGVLGARADVPEVLQDAFLRCWTKWQKGFRPDDPVAWIFVVTWNVAVDCRRKMRRSKETALIDEDTLMQPSTESSPAHRAERSDELARAQLAIERLADPEKQVFLMRVSGGLTFAAVAQALAIPEGTAKTRMRTALQRLRWALGADNSGQERSER